MILLFLLATLLEKPTVSPEHSCDNSRAILVVKPAATKNMVAILEVLYDGRNFGLKKGTEVAVDLKGMAYDKDRKYILFLDRGEKDERYFAVAQMRTEDTKEMRERVLAQLKKTGKVK